MTRLSSQVHLRQCRADAGGGANEHSATPPLRRSTASISPSHQANLSSGPHRCRRQVLLASGAALLLPQHAAQANSGSTGAAAPSAPELQQQYDSYAGTYDDLDGGAAAEALGFPQLRRQLLQRAAGDVLEVGVGTGLNLPLYRWPNIRSLTGLDLSPGMLAQAERRAGELRDVGWHVNLVQGDAGALSFPAASFDCVVDTFSMCVFPDPASAVREMARVVRPGGLILLLEHTRSEFPPLGWYQDVTAEAVAATGKGCYWNQDVRGLVTAAGLRELEYQSALGGLIGLIVAEVPSMQL